MQTLAGQTRDRLFTAWQTTAWKAGRSWCTLMHDSPMWPIHGQYQCGACHRRYPVPWAGEFVPPPPTNLVAPRHRMHAAPSFRSALLPRVILLAILLASHGRAAEELIVDPTAQAAIAFARYTVGLEQASTWSLETVEIEAALPKLEKQAHLRAIRRLLQLGKPEYQVLEIAGDQTVKRQVIARYLSAEVRAAAIPASSIAITPANYKFRFKGSLNSGGNTIYAFLVAPRKKREGLIKGELWIDGETGAMVRQSGYLVERPSIFVKRVNIVQETALCGGIAEERVTHLSIETRLVGRAELTIHERPFPDQARGSAPAIEVR
jgi:hypothetical protein